MSTEHIALLVDEARLTTDELMTSCTVSRAWVIEHMQAGVFVSDFEGNETSWTFSGRDLSRARQLIQVEQDFDANPELAGLVVDLIDELAKLRMRLRRAGLRED